jgi:hypothetical protein
VLDQAQRPLQSAASPPFNVFNLGHGRPSLTPARPYPQLHVRRDAVAGRAEPTHPQNLAFVDPSDVEPAAPSSLKPISTLPAQQYLGRTACACFSWPFESHRHGRAVVVRIELLMRRLHLPRLCGNIVFLSTVCVCSRLEATSLLVRPS